MQSEPIITCPKCGKQCVKGTDIVMTIHDSDGYKDEQPAYTCPEHGGKFIVSGQFAINIDEIPE